MFTPSCIPSVDFGKSNAKVIKIRTRTSAARRKKEKAAIYAALSNNQKTTKQAKLTYFSLFAPCGQSMWQSRQEPPQLLQPPQHPPRFRCRCSERITSTVIINNNINISIVGVFILSVTFISVRNVCQDMKPTAVPAQGCCDESPPQPAEP